MKNKPDTLLLRSVSELGWYHVLPLPPLFEGAPHAFLVTFQPDNEGDSSATIEAAEFLSKLQANEEES